MEKKGRKIDKKAIIEWFLVIITGIIINFLCVLIFSITSHATELEYFPMHQNENNNIPVEYYSIFDSYLDSENNYTVIRNGEVFSDGLGFWYVIYPKQDNYGIFAEIDSNGHTFTLYNIGNNPQYINGRLSITYDGQVYNTVYNQNPFTNFWSVESSAYSSSYSYISNFKIYTSNTENAQLVLNYGSGDGIGDETEEEPTIQYGHAMPPNPFEEPTLATGSNYTLPREVPESPTITNYSWTIYNSPSIDNSTVESLLESLIDIVRYNLGYMTTNISNEFDNLLTNIKDYFDYVAKTIQYYGGLIISNIQNGIETLYNNMASLVQPIYEKITELKDGFEEFADLFINPFDQEEFDEQIENSSFFTNYNAIIDNCEVISEIFDYAEERDHFSLYISFENPLANSQHRIISSEINFDWLVPLRSVYRPFVWVCVLIELFVGGARVLTRIIGGHGI